VRLALIALLLWSGPPGPPPFPWTSLAALREERPVANLGTCVPGDERTRVVTLLVLKPREFYRFWTPINGSDWVAIGFDSEGRPAWVWRGTSAGDELAVTSATPYDPAAPLVPCEALFRR
jgi:hypothetical protein